MFAAFSVSNSLLHICLNSFSCHNVLILLSLSGVTNLTLLVGVCAACIQMSPDEVVGSRDSCCHSIEESTVDVPISLFWQIFNACTALFLCSFA